MCCPASFGIGRRSRAECRRCLHSLHPASGLAALGGFAFVDPEAGIFTRAGQFFNGAAKAGKVVSDKKRDEANDKANREIERKEAEARRFNEPHYYSDDDYAPR